MAAASEGLDDSASPYVTLGGLEGLERLTEAFYARVARDPILRPLFRKNLAHEGRMLARFLAELCGGPGEYTERHGHPLMRARHQHVRIGPAESEAWVTAFAAALDDLAVADPTRSDLLHALTTAARSLINTETSGEPSAARAARRPQRPVLRRLNPLRSRHK